MDDQYGNPYYTTYEGDAPYVEETVEKQPGGVEPPELRGSPSETRNGELNPQGRISDEHVYGVRAGGDPLPDNLDVVSRQRIWVTDPKTNERFEVGRFELRWTKNTLTVTDYTREAANAQTSVYKR